MDPGRFGNNRVRADMTWRWFLPSRGSGHLGHCIQFPLVGRRYDADIGPVQPQRPSVQFRADPSTQAHPAGHQIRNLHRQSYDLRTLLRDRPNGTNRAIAGLFPQEQRHSAK